MSVYLDHNATTPMRQEVRARIDALLDQGLGNPSSLHGSGRRARQVIDDARMQAAAALGVHEDSVTFTSGGTEANNLALLGGGGGGLAPAGGQRPVLVTTRIEHSSVLGPAEALARAGHEVRLVGVDRRGRLDLDQLRSAARGARLVSVMAANNEIGVCPPLARVAECLGAGKDRPFLHTDAAQAVGRIELPWASIDLASVSGHKLGGPAGVGLLVHRPGIGLAPLMHGGGQELGLRPGTEPVAALGGFALALELACREREAFAARLDGLARELWGRLSERRGGLELLGPPLEPAPGSQSSRPPERLPGTLNILAHDVDGKVLVTRLDLEGLEVSAGSACASGSLEPSHVLLALGLDESSARAGLRVSLGRTTRAEDVNIAVEILGRTLGFARAP